MEGWASTSYFFYLGVCIIFVTPDNLRLLDWLFNVLNIYVRYGVPALLLLCMFCKINKKWPILWITSLFYFEEFLKLQFMYLVVFINCIHSVVEGPPKTGTCKPSYMCIHETKKILWEILIALRDSWFMGTKLFLVQVLRLSHEILTLWIFL
jgi:hypothetical protein